MPHDDPQRQTRRLPHRARFCRRVVRVVWGWDQRWATHAVAGLALKVAPHDPDLLIRYAGTRRSTHSSQAEAYDQYFKAANEATKTGEADLVMMSASMLLMAGAPDESVLEIARYAAGMAPDDKYVQDSLPSIEGRLASRRGDDAHAERLLWQAAHLDPGNELALDDLLVFLLDRGKRDEAMAILDERLPALRDSPRWSQKVRDLLAG